MKTVKSLWFLFPLTFIHGALWGQEIDLLMAYEKARAQSPIEKQRNYLESIQALNQKVTNAGNLPMVQLSGSASYQSDVVEFPLTLPGPALPEIPKDQYNVSLELRQKIYDGGAVRASSNMLTAQNALEKSQMEVSLYQIRSVINELYFGILSLQENERILGTALDEMDNQLNRVRAALDNGVLLPSDLYGIQKEKLKLEQRIGAISSAKQSLLKVLGNWLGEALLGDANLQVPEIGVESTNNNRLELMVFKQQSELLEQSRKQNSAKTLPKVFGYATGGFGQPNPLNFFETQFDPYYRVGVKLEWTPWDWGRTKNRSKIIGLNQQIVQTKKEQFERGIEDQKVQQLSEIEKLESLIQTDRQLVELQTKIKDEASERLNAGTISMTDFLSELNELTQAKTDLNLHTVQLEKAKIDLLTLTGNLP